MKRKSPENRDDEHQDLHPGRESNWCEKYGYFIDLDACQARSLSRTACRRCYKSLLQLSLPLGDG